MEDPARFLPASNKVFEASIWAAIYLIWRTRNEFVFQNIIRTAQRVFEDIQIQAFLWINRRARLGSLDWDLWVANPIQTAVKILR